MIRKIVEIDESLCDGCGECIPSCAEGALFLEGGKAKLAADKLCDGLGACLGDCPRGALRVVERPAEAFDEAAVAEHLGRDGAHRAARAPAPDAAPGGCPGSKPMDFGAPARRPRLTVVPDAAPAALGPAAGGSQLSQWPVQLRLVSPAAPWFRGADLLVAADCVPFAYAKFHEDYLAGRRLVVGCPKLDDLGEQFRKLQEIVAHGGVRSVTVVKMSVPCCNGIAAAARAAVDAAGRAVPLVVETLGVRGERL